MRKNFNSVQMLETSENCDKFSKSVSYETLVGGTTTTGSEYKQTRRLFLGSADKPLTAVGSLTSLLCNSAKVMEKLFYSHSEPKAKNPKKTEIVIIGRGCEPIISAESKRDPRLIAMQSPRMTDKALSLSGASSKKQKESSLILRKAKFQAIFKFVLSSASGGGKYNRISAFVSMPVLLIRRSREKFFKKNFRDDSLFCFRFTKVLVFTLIFTILTTGESRADCNSPDSKGNCKTLEEKGTCGTGCSYTYDSKTKTVYITATGDNARIGDSAFASWHYENNSMPAQTFVINGAIKIGSNAFTASSEVISGANGALILTRVEHHGFGDNATLSGTIIIPEGATFGSLAFHGVTLAEDAKIYCGVENCKQKMIDSCNDWGDENDRYRQSCLSSVNNMGDKLLDYPDGCTKMGATGCTKCKNENFKLNDGECDRLRWTPAEAAKVLTDDNNNSVTITFKK